MTIKQIGFILLGLAVAWIIGYAVAKWTIKPTLTEHTTYLPGKTDTMWLPAVTTHTSISHVTPTHIDTTANDIVSKIDTCLTKDSSTVCLKVEHHSTPNTFSVDASWTLRPLLMSRVDTLKVERTLTLPCSEKWFERFHVGLGISAVYLDDKVRIAPSVGLYYRIF